MAQPTYAIDYLGAEYVVAGENVLSSDLITKYPTATVIVMKSEGVRVNIDGTTMFPVSFDDTSYLTTGRTYRFDSDCVVAVGIYKAIV